MIRAHEWPCPGAINPAGGIDEHFRSRYCRVHVAAVTSSAFAATTNHPSHVIKSTSFPGTGSPASGAYTGPEITPTVVPNLLAASKQIDTHPRLFVDS